MQEFKLKKSTDKEMVSQLMKKHFDDDNTFSGCSEGFGTIAIVTKDGDSSLEDNDSMPEIEIKMISEKYFFKRIFLRNFELISIMGLRPQIRFLD